MAAVNHAFGGYMTQKDTEVTERIREILTTGEVDCDNIPPGQG